MIDAIN